MNAAALDLPSYDLEEILEEMTRLKAAREPFALATVISARDSTAARAGAKAVLRADGGLTGWVGGGCTLGAVRKAAAETLTDGKARLLRIRPREAEEAAADDIQEVASACPSGGTVEVFVEPMLPRPRLVVLGASRAARALCDLGKALGFSVAASALAADLEGLPETDSRLPNFDLSGLGANPGFLVVATQGKRDREALEAALATGARYVAFLGSRRKAAALREQLAARGVSAEALTRLRSPAGLNIHAVTPEEIALSILAEIVQERRRPPEDRPAPPPAAEEPGVETRVVASDHPSCCD